MRYSRLIPSLFAAALAVCAPATQANPHETTLANGLRVIVKEDRRAPTAVHMVWYRAGGMDGPVKIGMDVMTKQERVQVDSLVGHGGIFATPKVAQKILAAAFNTPIKVMSTAAEGGAWGMAVLANYLWNTNEDHSNLADFLDGCVFKDAQSTTEKPVASDVVGFEDFFARFTKGLPIEHAAIETINLEDK